LGIDGKCRDEREGGHDIGATVRVDRPENACGRSTAAAHFAARPPVFDGGFDREDPKVTRFLGEMGTRRANAYQIDERRSIRAPGVDCVLEVCRGILCLRGTGNEFDATKDDESGESSNTHPALGQH
jgi:hypothetical protein